MKRMIAFVLALTLVSVGVPALAHDAAFESECKERYGPNEQRCKATPEGRPAHDRCKGERDQMDQDEENDELVEKAIGIADTEQGSLTAYAYATEDAAQAQMDDEDGTLVPGVLWIENNGFSSLQQTDWACKSNAHEDPDAWQVHADRVLI